MLQNCIMVESELCPCSSSNLIVLQHCTTIHNSTRAQYANAHLMCIAQCIVAERYHNKCLSFTSIWITLQCNGMRTHCSQALLWNMFQLWGCFTRNWIVLHFVSQSVRAVTLLHMKMWKLIVLHLITMRDEIESQQWMQKGDGQNWSELVRVTTSGGRGADPGQP